MMRYVCNVCLTFVPLKLELKSLYCGNIFTDILPVNEIREFPSWSCTAKLSLWPTQSRCRKIEDQVRMRFPSVNEQGNGTFDSSMLHHQHFCSTDCDYIVWRRRDLFNHISRGRPTVYVFRLLFSHFCCVNIETSASEKAISPSRLRLPHLRPIISSTKEENKKMQPRCAEKKNCGYSFLPHIVRPLSMDRFRQTIVEFLITWDEGDNKLSDRLVRWRTLKKKGDGCHIS